MFEDDNKRVRVEPLPLKQKAKRKIVDPNIKTDKNSSGAKIIITSVEEAQNNQLDTVDVKKKRGRPKKATKDKKSLGPLQKLGFVRGSTQKQKDALAHARFILRKKREEKKAEFQAQFVSPQTQTAEEAEDKVLKTMTKEEDIEFKEQSISANPQRNILTDPRDTPEPLNTMSHLAASLKKEELDESKLVFNNFLNESTMTSNTYTLDGVRSSMGETGRLQNASLKQPRRYNLEFL